MKRWVFALLGSLCGCHRGAAPVVVSRQSPESTASFARRAPAHTRFLIRASAGLDAQLLAPYLPECDFKQVVIEQLELAFAQPAELRLDLRGKLPLATADCVLEGLRQREALGTWKLRATPLPGGVRIATDGGVADGRGGSALLTQRFEELTSSARYAFVADIAPGGGLLEARSLEHGGAEVRIGLPTPVEASAAAQWLTAAVVASRDGTLRKLSATSRASSLIVRSPTADARLALLIKQELLEIFRTSSESMQPTLLPGDNVVVLKPRHDRAPERGDLVAFASPRDESQVFIKRVIGVAGDRIELDGHQLRINGAPLPTALDTQSSLAESPGGAEGQLWRETLGKHEYRTWHDDDASPAEPLDVTVEPESVFVLGDNRDQSFDSRHFGTVPLKLLRGRAVLVWLSLDGNGPRWERSGIEPD